MKGFTTVVGGARSGGGGDRAAASRREIKVDLKKETVGKPPQTFEPMVGTWIVAQDGADKVIMVDGRPWVASKDNPTQAADPERAQAVRHEQRRADGQREAVRVLPGRGAEERQGLLERHDHREVQDRRRRRRPLRPGILFNVKPNGDWLCVRYNDTENNVGLWEFHNGIRRLVKFSDRDNKFMLDRAAWHELKLDGRRRVDQGARSTARSASTTRSAPRPARAATAPRRIPISSPTTTPCSGRPSPDASGCGRRPTAPAISRTTSSRPK